MKNQHPGRPHTHTHTHTHIVTSVKANAGLVWSGRWRLYIYNENRVASRWSGRVKMCSVQGAVRSIRCLVFFWCSINHKTMASGRAGTRITTPTIPIASSSCREEYGREFAKGGLNEVWEQYKGKKASVWVFVAATHLTRTSRRPNPLNRVVLLRAEVFFACDYHAARATIPGSASSAGRRGPGGSSLAQALLDAWHCHSTGL